MGHSHGVVRGGDGGANTRLSVLLCSGNCAVHLMGVIAWETNPCQRPASLVGWQ